MTPRKPDGIVEALDVFLPDDIAEPKPANRPSSGPPPNELLLAVPARIGRLLRASRATGLVTPSAGTKKGTGFLIAPDLLITNNHVMNGDPNPPVPTTKEQAAGTVLFGYAKNMFGEDLVSQAYDLDSDAFFAVSVELDYVIVGVRGRPGDRWGTLPLPRDKSKLAKRDDVFVVQHPNGNPQAVVMSGNTIQEFNATLLQYTADTDQGSSGSPVLDKDGEVVGLHHAGGALNGAQSGAVSGRNEAIRADLIWERIEAEVLRHTKRPA